VKAVQASFLPVFTVMSAVLASIKAAFNILKTV